MTMHVSVLTTKRLEPLATASVIQILPGSADRKVQILDLHIFTATKVPRRDLGINLDLRVLSPSQPAGFQKAQAPRSKSQHARGE